MKLRSIFQILSINPSGAYGAPLSADELGVYLANQIGTDHENKRNAQHQLRDELYRDGGVRYMCGVIDEVFTDDKVKELRKKWVKHTRFNNAMKRIVNALATVYVKPARRMVGGGEANEEKYQDFLTAILFDEQMLQLSRLLNLHRAMLGAIRVRETGAIDDSVSPPVEVRAPVFDMVSPGDARVVLHPNDNKQPVAWVVRASHATARTVGQAENVPAWVLWSDVNRISLTAGFKVIEAVEHKLGVCPYVPLTLGPPVAGFWPGEEGEDLVSARTMIWFQDVLLAKESKSATKQPIIQGDGAMTARGQAADSEIPNELSDGQNVTTVDMSMDLSMFRDTGDYVLANTGYNYGLSAGSMKHEGVQSAEARRLMLMPVNEIREQQQPPCRRFETVFAMTSSKVLAVDLPAMGFDATDFRMEFGAPVQTLEPKEEFELFVAERQAGTDNTIAYLKRKHPGIDDVGAKAELVANIAVETARNIEMRQLQAVSGSLGAGMPPAAGSGPQSGEVDPGAPLAIGNDLRKLVPPSPSASVSAAPSPRPASVPRPIGAPPDQHPAPPRADDRAPPEPDSTDKKPPTKGPAPSADGAALNGAQVESMVTVVTTAIAGRISRESAIQILVTGFKVTPAEATAMLGPEDFEPAPPQGPPSGGPA